MRRISSPFWVVGLVFLASCGHPATHDDCDKILTKSAELKLKEDNITDPALVSEKLQSLKQARGEELLKSCVGRMITNSALQCVERAQTADAVDSCLY